MTSNSWDFNFMIKKTQFQNIDNYFIKYNKLFLKKEVSIGFIVVNKCFHSFYYGYTPFNNINQIFRWGMTNGMHDIIFDNISQILLCMGLISFWWMQMEPLQLMINNGSCLCLCHIEMLTSNFNFIKLGICENGCTCK
jgi:hypothetical protein